MKIGLIYALGIVGFGIYSLFYGAYSYYVFGTSGLLLSSIIYILAGIVGVINIK